VWAIHFSLCAFFSSKIWFSFTAPASVLLWLLIRPSIPCAPAELFLLIAFHSRSALRGCDFLLCPAPVVLQLDLSFGLVLRFSRSISPRQKFHRYFSRSLGESGFKVSTLSPASFSAGSLGPRAHDFLAVGCLLWSQYQSGPGVPLLSVRTPALIFPALVRALSPSLCVGS
jgi:hypothetical protein